MRVTTGRRARDERGAVAVIVALCAVMMFGFAAYALDAGHLWETRRSMVTASDAAALAAGGALATGATNSQACDATAPDYLDKNVDGATLEACTVERGNYDNGRVTVKGGTVADFTFAGIFGLDDSDVDSSTTVQWGRPKSVSGLRPFGLCLFSNQQLVDWLNLAGGGPTGQSAPIKITYDKGPQGASCENAPGNWGVLDFDGGNNSNNDTKDWTLNGYPGEVSISPPTIPGNTGSFSQSLDAELSYLRDNGIWFGLPVFDRVEGNGSNAEFNIVAFAYVKLVDFKANGAEAQRYMTLVFDRGVLEGVCCDTGPDTGVRVIRICDVDTLAPDPNACQVL